MVKFRISKIDGDDKEIIAIVTSLISSRKKPNVVKSDSAIRIGSPSVHFSLTEILEDTRIPKRAFWVNVTGTRRENYATLVAETFIEKGAIVDNWE